MKPAVITFVAWFLSVTGASGAASGQALTCDDVEFNASAVSEFPNVARSCHSIVERQGRLFVRLVADVVKASRDGTITLDFKAPDGARFRQDFKPRDGFRALISGRPTAPRNLRRGQEIRIYLPTDRWRAAD